ARGAAARVVAPDSRRGVRGLREVFAMNDPDRHPEAEEPRPWEETGVVRRDCEPHRGELLRLIGIGSLAAPLAGLLLSPLLGFLAGISLGATVWVLAGGDLAKMEAGLMDPEGRRVTRTARRLGLAGVLVSLCVLVVGVVAVLVLLYLTGQGPPA